VDPEAVLASAHVPDLADPRVRALVDLDRAALLVALLQRLKLDAHNALHHAAVLVVSSSIRRPKKGQ